MKDLTDRGAEPQPVATATDLHKILIVEDDGVVALFLTDLLEELDYVVCGIATSGEEALRLAASERPDLAVVDVGLKGRMDGISAALRLRDAFDLRVVFATGDASAPTFERAQAAHPVAILTKPYMPEQLAGALRKAFSW